MAPPLAIDRDTGSILIGDITLLEPLEAKSTVEPKVRDLVAGFRDHGNGYEWLYLHGLSFGGRSAGLSLCFHDDLLEQASWSVRLPDAATNDSWPTRDEIDSEVAFVRRTLANDMGIHAGPFPWGEVWSGFDAKGFMAASGLRYRRA